MGERVAGRWLRSIEVKCKKKRDRTRTRTRTTKSLSCRYFVIRDLYHKCRL